jgi:hypothetical protein
MVLRRRDWVGWVVDLGELERVLVRFDGCETLGADDAVAK